MTASRATSWSVYWSVPGRLAFIWASERLWFTRLNFHWAIWGRPAKQTRPRTIANWVEVPLCGSAQRCHLWSDSNCLSLDKFQRHYEIVISYRTCKDITEMLTNRRLPRWCQWRRQQVVWSRWSTTGVPFCHATKCPVWARHVVQIAPQTKKSSQQHAYICIGMHSICWQKCCTAIKKKASMQYINWEKYFIFC